MPYKDLRAYLNRLEHEGEIIHIQREVDPVWEVAAVIRRAGEKAIFCDRVKGFDIPMVGNLFGSPRKVELCLELERNNLASQSRMGYGINELQVAGGLRRSPVELVQCKTVDLAVPAHAEIVLEGFIPPDEREPEGPYGEYPGYYGSSDASPVIHYTAMTTRKNPIYQMILIGKPPTENNYLTLMPKASTVYQIIRECVNEIRDIYITPGSGGSFHCIVSIKKRFEAEPRRAMLAALGSRATLRQVIIVDDDIDIRNPVEVEWAVATRSEFRKDTIIADDMYPGLNPAPMGKAGQTFTTAMGIDATLPLEREYPKVCDVHQETLKRVDTEWDSYVSPTDATPPKEKRKLAGRKSL